MNALLPSPEAQTEREALVNTELSKWERYISAQKLAILPNPCLCPAIPCAPSTSRIHILDKPSIVSSIRNMLGFTGDYQGVPVSVMSSGMGIPSALIYCTELFEKFAVKRIIRVGTCATVSPDISLRDLIIAIAASTDSSMNRVLFDGFDFSPIANFDMASSAATLAKRRNLRHHVGGLFTSDHFYRPDDKLIQRLQSAGILGLEMETAGIYSAAARFDAKALSICSVTDHKLEGISISPQDRQSSLDTMIQLALDVIRSPE